MICFDLSIIRLMLQMILSDETSCHNVDEVLRLVSAIQYADNTGKSKFFFFSVLILYVFYVKYSGSVILFVTLRYFKTK